MLLVPKLPIFPTFLFGQHTPGKCLLRYSRAKKRLSRLSKQQVQKVEQFPVFLKRLTHFFGPKRAIIPISFLGNIGQENIFYDMLERKNAFLGKTKQEVQIVEKLTFLQRG